jgi:hypothetical protein
MRTRFLAAAAALAALASPAQANWQYSRWGMSVAQVAASAHQKVLVQSFPELDVPGSRVLAGTPYIANGLSFTAAFGFDQADRLNRVTLYLRDLRACGDLRRALDELYGRPLKRVDLPGEFSSSTWRDPGAGNVVTFSRNERQSVTTTCMAIYQPMATGL